MAAVRITLIAMLLVPSAWGQNLLPPLPPPSPVTRLTETEAVRALQGELQQRVAESRFSGVVLVAKDGKPLLLQAYGSADLQRGIHNSATTKFRFGSLGKMFTAVAILQLVQAGAVHLDDPLKKYLPDYPDRDVAQVTVHQLLTHTAGTGDIFGPEFDRHRRQLRTLNDYIALYGQRGLDFPAGSRHVYSNYGYILLGRIIEVVSGRSYADYVREHVFRPAGMMATDNLPEETRVPDLALPYTRGLDAAAGPLHSAFDTLPYSGTSAGGGYTTAGDLLKFALALQSHRLLSAHYTDLAITGKVDTPMRGVRYGYGFEDARSPDGVRHFGNSGGSAGMNASLTILPAAGYVVVVLANLDPPAANDVERFIVTRLPAR